MQVFANLGTGFPTLDFLLQQPLFHLEHPALLAQFGVGLPQRHGVRL